MKYSIVIPLFNEEKNIVSLLKSFSNSSEPFELILVNNGSTDKTESILQKELINYPFAKTIKVEKNLGYGHGIMKGLESARGEYLAWTHGDLQTSPADVFKGFKLLEQNPKSLVKGNRSGRPLMDRFFTRGMSFFEFLIHGSWLHDINAQPNVFSRSFFKTFKNPPLDFCLELYVYILAKKQGRKIIRFEVQFPPRIEGESSWDRGFKSKIFHSKIYMKNSIKLKENL